MARGNTGTKSGPRSGATEKSVAKKEAKQDVAIYDYGEDAGGGFDTMERGDFAIPFLYLLQSNSPIVERGEATAGAIMNTVDNTLYPSIRAKEEPGIFFVPCYSEHLVVEWRPQDEGGGLVAQHATDSAVVLEAKQRAKKFNELKSPDGNDLVDTYYCYGVNIKDPEDWSNCEQTIIAWNSTKIKPYRQWMTRMKTMRVPTPGGGRITPPMWAHLWRITTVMQTKNNKNFYNFEINFAGDNAADSRIPPSDPLFIVAKDLNALAKEGQVKADTTNLTRDAGGSEPDDDVGGEVIDGEKIPF